MRPTGDVSFISRQLVRSTPITHITKRRERGDKRKQKKEKKVGWFRFDENYMSEQ